MRKYLVTIPYTTYIDVEVEAESEKEAIDKAFIEAGGSDYDNQFLNNVISDGDPDVEEITDEE